MSRQDLFDRILRGMNAAVLDDSHWLEAAALIDEFCGAKGNNLVFGDGARTGEIELFFWRFCYRGERREDLERDYFEVYQHIDESVPRVRLLPDSQLTPLSSLYTEEEKKESAAYNEARPRSDTLDSLFVRMDGPEGSRIAWNIADPVDEEGWSFSRIEAIEALLPHLRQFVRVRQALVDARALATSTMGLLDNDRVGVIHLDRRGRVTAANDRARALLNGRDRLRSEHGGLRAALPVEDARLQELLAAALTSLGGSGASGSILVTRADPQPRLVVHVKSASEAEGAPRGTRLGALVLVDDPAAGSYIDPERVGSALGLTPTESRIAALLAQGMSIDSVAAATGTSRTTVKWHIRHIYAKHGLSRQVELAQLVASLPHVLGVQSPRR